MTFFRWIRDRSLLLRCLHARKLSLSLPYRDVYDIAITRNTGAERYLSLRNVWVATYRCQTEETLLICTDPPISMQQLRSDTLPAHRRRPRPLG